MNCWCLKTKARWVAPILTEIFPTNGGDRHFAPFSRFNSRDSSHKIQLSRFNVSNERAREKKKKALIRDRSESETPHAIKT